MEKAWWLRYQESLTNRSVTTVEYNTSSLTLWAGFSEHMHACPVHLSSLMPRMSTFTLAISCLTASNLSWFMDLTFQVPIQHCSLQHRTLLPSPVTSTTGGCFCFGSVSSFFLELFLYCCLVAYWVPTNVRSSSFTVLSFCLFILFMGFSRQEYWSGLPFPSPVDHVLSEFSTMTCPSWVALHGVAHSPKKKLN